MIGCVNLIPDSRQEIRVCRNRRKRWVISGSVYGLVLLVGCGFLCIFSDQGDPEVASEIEEVQVRIESIGDSVAKIRSRLGQYELTLTANRDLIEHPDWGLLLGLLANSLGDSLVLRKCEIKQWTLPGAGQSGSSSEDTSSVTNATFQLVANGMGRTQAAVSQLALRLERTGLFDDVKLVDTNLEPYFAGKAVAFRLECHLGETLP